MYNLIQKHGKEFAKELFEMVMIEQHLDNENAKELLLKYKIITKATKTIKAYYNHSVWNTNYINIKNGSGKNLVDISYEDNEINNIKKELYE